MDNLNPILWGYLMANPSSFWQTEDNGPQSRSGRERDGLCRQEGCPNPHAFSWICAAVAALVGFVDRAIHSVAIASGGAPDA
jgi:hypothetical protein